MIIAPTINPVGAFGGHNGPFTNITPFTYRSGEALIEYVERLRVFVTSTISPYVDDAVQTLVTTFIEEVTRVVDDTNSSLTSQALSVNEFVAAFGAELTAQLAAQDTDVNTRNTATREYVDGAVLSIINSTIAVTDPVMTAIDADKLTKYRIQSDARNAEKFYTAHVLSGPGFDPTGVVDSTTAFNTLLAGLDTSVNNTVQVPTGSVIKLTASVTIPRNCRIIGPGELRWTAGISESPGLRLIGDNISVEGLTLTNPLELQSTTGGRNIGISIEGNNHKILGNTVDRFQNGVVVLAAGEFYNHTISNNRIKDVIGAGGGADSVSNLGEDRADGILTWGAQATITGNVVNAKSGADARIGIHCEGLSAFSVTNAPHNQALVTISGNVVYGTFRRGIVSETVANAVISGNVVADATWWGIAVITGSNNNVVSGNSIIWTRKSTDNQGSAWEPIRSGIMVYGTISDCVLVGNSVRMKTGSSAVSYVTVSGPLSPGPENTLISANNFSSDDAASAPTHGMYLGAAYAARTKIFSNSVTKFKSAGVISFGGNETEIRGNTFEGILTVSEHGVRAESPSTGITVVSNTIKNVLTGILAVNQNTGPLIASSNLISGATIGIDAFGTTSGEIINNNINPNVVTPLKNISSEIKIDGNRNIRGSITWNPVSMAPGTGETSVNVLINGAAQSDFVLASASHDLQGVTLTAYVLSAGIVKFRLQNGTGTTIDLDSGNYRAKIVGR